MRFEVRKLLLPALPLLFVACAADEPDAAPARLALAAGGEPTDTMVVYKTPTCGCCSAWVDHVEEHGFAVVTHDLDRLDDIKRELGVPAGQISCHTATVRGYTIEGHVPADLIRRMLDENAKFKGLTVPGMPIGSPGMEGAFKQRYKVLSFDERGSTEVYAER